MNETNYTPVADGYYDCRIVSAKRTDKHFGHSVGNNVVYRIGVAPIDIDGAQAFYADLPVMLVPNGEWEWYDETAGRSMWRTVTTEDAKANIEYVQSIFPAWREYCDGLADGEESAALAWFGNRELTANSVVRAKLRTRVFSGVDGSTRTSCEAKFFAKREFAPVISEAETATIVKAMHDCGFKLGGGKAKNPTAAKPMKPTPPTPPPAKATGADIIAQLQEHALELYANGDHGAKDPAGAKYYETIASFIGKPAWTWNEWTVSEWQKICDKLDDMPF